MCVYVNMSAMLRSQSHTVTMHAGIKKEQGLIFCLFYVCGVENGDVASCPLVVKTLMRVVVKIYMRVKPGSVHSGTAS